MRSWIRSRSRSTSERRSRLVSSSCALRSFSASRVSSRRSGQLLAQLLHRVEASAVEKILEIQDVLLLLADLRLQRAVEAAQRPVAVRRSAGEWRAGEAGAVHGGSQARRRVPEGAAQRFRRQLVLEQLGARGVQLLREGPGVAVLLSRLRVPLRGGIGVGRRRLLLQAIAEKGHQPLPERLRPDQRLAAVLGGREDLDRLRRRDAALRTVHCVVVLCLQVIADPVPRPQAQRRDLPSIRARSLPDQRHFGQAIVVGGGPGDLHAPLRIDLQHRLLRRVDVHLRRLVGDDLDRTRRTLRDRAPARVGEPQAPLSRLTEREAARELPAAGARGVELHRRAIHHGERLREIAVGASGDPHFGAARRAQIAGGALFSARRQAGVRRIEVGDGEIAGDRRQLDRRRPALSRPEAQHAARDVTRSGRGDDRPDQAAGSEREQRPAQRRGGQDPLDVDLPRRLRCPHLQQREQLGGDAAGILARELDAAEQVRRSADQPREPAWIPRAQGSALQRRPQAEPHHRTHREGAEDPGQPAGERGPIHAGHEDGAEQRHRGPGDEQGAGAQGRETQSPLPRARKNLFDVAPRPLPIRRQLLSP